MTSVQGPNARGPDTRGIVERFLYDEAALLDAWRLDDWLSLFTDDAVYEVPPAGSAADVSSTDTLFYIADDRFRLGHRVARLNKPDAHSEFPRSICARLISNVRVTAERDVEVEADCAFVTYRSKNGVTDIFPGRHRYRLRRAPEGFRIAWKRTDLSLESLRPQGRVSIIP